MTGPVQVTLTPEEWKLVSTLRSVPESPLKERLDALLAELLNFAVDPRCAESQADGDPCTNTTSDCDSCRRVTDLIEILRRRASAE